MSRNSPRNQSAKLRVPYPDATTTTIFISNLHCPSCVEGIQDSLSALRPAPVFISHSIVSHSVVIRHNTSLAVDAISGALEVAGFEIHSIFQDSDSPYGPVEIHSTETHQGWEESLEQAVQSWARP
ncbi:hypothetical protein EJ04DRAFT_505488, partial [Polyplosphaeria fusca]